MRPIVRPLALLLLLLPTFFTACTPGDVEIVSETNEKQYQLAKSYESQGRMEEALSAYLRVIDSRRDAPESHLDAGNIYLKQLKDPIRAIYHFDRYLQLKPGSQQATQVRQLIETAQKEFARQLPAQPYQGDLERIDLMELVKNLKQENDSLKRDLVAAQARVKQLETMVGEARRVTPAQTQSTTTYRAPLATTATRSATSTGNTQRTAPDPASVPRTYQVQSGDSLSSISRKFYGTPSRWIDIYQANRDRLASENALKVGQELRIP
ncbi:Cell division protein CpoB [Coraliomargarita parva]|uniref:Cell division protein CpoB n=1 Tax=Coraliomargarita parva TaxID=3014050 RepID=UPI0022B2EA38|nr:LysM peptidoglycan-binding domain-containing protein [Coraliomargarita parva]